ncbi:MAG: hypothetical protein Q4C72_04375 [Eubacteriales bacterium]|nr:hypothetical protein [Eubacteriales bacterium]
MGMKELQAERIRDFTELCKWLEESHAISEIMERLSVFDVDELEQLRRENELQYDAPLPQSLRVVQEYCALARVQRRVCAAAASA